MLIKDIISVINKLFPKPGTVEGKNLQTEDAPPAKEESVLTMEDILVPFHGPLAAIPKNRTEVYQIYGRPPEEKAHLQFPKAKLKTVENLPGSWNGGMEGKCRLYMLETMEPYLREALRRCKQLEVLDYIEKMGCYNFRPMRHDPDAPLSYHSWGAAVDINSSDNAGKYKSTKQPILSPYSRQWMALYPKAVPYELVLAFKSVGFTWGGDWGWGAWKDLVKSHGVGYDGTAFVSKGWEHVEYVDGMHFQIVQ